MSRVALLPARGDPFTLLLSFRYFENVWRDEVDRLLVLTNSTIEQEVVNFLRDYLARDPKVIFMHTGRQIEHGGALAQLFDSCSEDIVVFVEDDSLVLKKGVVDTYCKTLESGTWDMVGSVRDSCDPELAVQEKSHFKLGSDANFWPCFFFARRSDLLKTDRNFGSKNFPAGQPIPLLGGWAPPRPQCSDTFVWTSIQLRALGLRALSVPQYRGDDDLGFPDATWMHTGAPSALIETEITDDRNVPLIRRQVPDTVPLVDNELHGGPYEIERRFAWAVLCLEAFGRDMDRISGFRELYRAGISKYVVRFGLNMQDIKNRAERYRQVIGL